MLMRATTDRGEVFDLPPSANIAGERIVSVRLTAKDFDDDRVFAWLQEVVAPRMIRVPDAPETQES